MINPVEFVQLRAAFNKIDKDLSGTIEVKELEEALKQAGVEIDAEEMKSVVKQLDYDDKSPMSSIDNGKKKITELMKEFPEFPQA